LQQNCGVPAAPHTRGGGQQLLLMQGWSGGQQIFSPVAGLPHTCGVGQQTPSMQGWSGGQVQSRVPPQPSGKMPQTPAGQVFGSQRQTPLTQTELGGQQIFWSAAPTQTRGAGQQLPLTQGWPGGQQIFWS
jgi:hypothetical protein